MVTYLGMHVYPRSVISLEVGSASPHEKDVLNRCYLNNFFLHVTLGGLDW